MTFKLPEPDTQIEFATRLLNFRSLYLQEALSATVKSLNIPNIDRELATLVSAHGLSRLASHGLRGETVFAVPIVLNSNPRLLAYYRLLYGYSQKEFYGSGTGMSLFKSMEVKGVVGKRIQGKLDKLCEHLNHMGELLISGISISTINSSFLNELTILTLGPQFRGGANVRKGVAGIKTVFNAIHEIVQRESINSSDSIIEIISATGRKVSIEFAPDPDIIIREEMRPGVFRDIIAIEVKAGSDFSNIHNRIGEAEKSHQKAKAAGYVECWTVVNVDKIDLNMARRESPSTNRFYRISDLLTASGDDYQDFRDRVISITGIKGSRQV